MDLTVKAGESIQAAIDAAHSKGGARVVLEPGIHPSATLHLKSFVELHLCGGAKIQGSSKPEEYEDVCDPGFDAVAPENSRKCLIAAVHAENIAITGSGEINGAGPTFYDTNVPAGSFFGKPPHPRPRMVQFYDCKRVAGGRQPWVGGWPAAVGAKEQSAV
jgi:polygalacturonase